MHRPYVLSSSRFARSYSGNPCWFLFLKGCTLKQPDSREASSRARNGGDGPGTHSGTSPCQGDLHRSSFTETQKLPSGVLLMRRHLWLCEDCCHGHQYCAVLTLLHLLKCNLTPVVLVSAPVSFCAKQASIDTLLHTPAAQWRSGSGTIPSQKRNVWP